MGLAKEIKYFVLRRVLNHPACWFLHLYAKTLRLQFENIEPLLQHLENKGRLILACWHQRFFGGFYFPQAYQKFPCIMISQSRDGDFIANVVKHMGWIPVRGSSTRGWKKGLEGMVAGIKQHGIAAHIVDGPTGPARVIKPGLIYLAQKTGAAICGAFISYENPWIFNSWDRFMVPKPFSRVLIHAGPLEFIPEGMDDAEFEKVRLDIEQKMIRGYEEADRYWSGLPGDSK